MRRLPLSLAVVSMLSLSTPALAEQPAQDSTGATSVTAHLVAQAQATAPTVEDSPAVEPGTSSTPGEVTPHEVLQLLATAVNSRNWALLACALVLGAVYLVRRFIAPRVQWLASDVAGVGLSLVVAVCLSLSATLSAGKPLSLSVVLGALLTAAGASGLWSWGRKLVSALTPVPSEH